MFVIVIFIMGVYIYYFFLSSPLYAVTCHTQFVIRLGWIMNVEHHFQRYFKYNMVFSFNVGGKPEYPEKAISLTLETNKLYT